MDEKIYATDKERHLPNLNRALDRLATTHPRPKVLTKTLHVYMAELCCIKDPTIPGMEALAPTKTPRKPATGRCRPPESPAEVLNHATQIMGNPCTPQQAEKFFLYYAARCWKGAANWPFALKSWINNDLDRAGRATAQSGRTAKVKAGAADAPGLLFRSGRADVLPALSAVAMPKSCAAW